MPKLNVEELIPARARQRLRRGGSPREGEKSPSVEKYFPPPGSDDGSGIYKWWSMISAVVVADTRPLHPRANVYSIMFNVYVRAAFN